MRPFIRRLVIAKIGKRGKAIFVFFACRPRVWPDGRWQIPVELPVHGWFGVKKAARQTETGKRTAVQSRALRNSGLANQGGSVTAGSHLLLGDVHEPRAALQHVASLVISALPSRLCVRPPGLAERPRRLSPSHSVWRANEGEWAMR